MKVYQLIAAYEWDGETTLMIADSYKHALQGLVMHLNSLIYLGDVDGNETEEGPNVFRHCNMYEDIFTIEEMGVNALNNHRFDTSNIVFQIFSREELAQFVNSREFYQGQDFSPELLESWNTIDNILDR